MGLLDGFASGAISGALGGAEQYFQEERAQDRAMSLEEFRLKKTKELEKFKHGLSLERIEAQGKVQKDVASQYAANRSGGETSYGGVAAKTLSALESWMRSEFDGPIKKGWSKAGGSSWPGADPPKDAPEMIASMKASGDPRAIAAANSMESLLPSMHSKMSVEEGTAMLNFFKEESFMEQASAPSPGLLDQGSVAPPPQAPPVEGYQPGATPTGQSAVPPAGAQMGDEYHNELRSKYFTD